MSGDAQPIARVDDPIQHTHAQTGRTWGALLGAVVGAVVCTVVVATAAVALAAIEVGTFGAATPLVVAAGVIGASMLGTGAGLFTMSTFSNVGADIGRTQHEDEGPITTGDKSVLVGKEQKACAHIESNVSCKRHKHLSTPNPLAPDVIDPAQEQIVQGSKTVRVGREKHPVARIGSQGTCGFAVAQGCASVIVGGQTITIGKIGDGDDPAKKDFDALKRISGYLMLGGMALMLPVDAPAILGGLVGMAVIGKGVSMIPDGPMRDVVEAGLSLLPLVKAGDVFSGEKPTEVGVDTDTDTNTNTDSETQSTPETTPEPVPETAPEPVPDPVPESAPAPAPETAPERVSETTSEPAPEPEATSEPAPETVPEHAPEPAPETVPESAPEPAPEPAPEVWKAPCFLAGTHVATTTGTVAIERLAVGECVIAKDFASLSLSPTSASILALHTGSTRTIVLVQLGDSVIRCTRQHPFFVQGEGWKDACTLQSGDLLLTSDNRTVEVSAVRMAHLTRAVPTYNLTVETAHTYYVLAGRHQVLVHNGPPVPDYNQPLYWLFGKKPVLRPTDTDGLSIWRTDSQADVDTLMRTRSDTMGRSGSDPHGYWTQEQFDAALSNGGLAAPQTPGTGPIAEALGEDNHYSIRPADAPDGSLWDESLSPDEIKATDAFKNLNDSLNANLKPPASTTPAKVLCG